jgi:hypothetical protein
MMLDTTGDVDALLATSMSTRQQFPHHVDILRMLWKVVHATVNKNDLPTICSLTRSRGYGHDTQQDNIIHSKPAWGSGPVPRATATTTAEPIQRGRHLRPPIEATQWCSSICFASDKSNRTKISFHGKKNFQRAVTEIHAARKGVHQAMMLDTSSQSASMSGDVDALLLATSMSTRLPLSPTQSNNTRTMST